MPRVISPSPVLSCLFTSLPQPTGSKPHVSASIILNLTMSLHDQFSKERTEAQGGETTGPGPYNRHMGCGPSCLTIETSAHPFLPEPNPSLQDSAPLLPPGVFNKQSGPRPGAGCSEMNR